MRSNAGLSIESGDDWSSGDVTFFAEELKHGNQLRIWRRLKGYCSRYEMLCAFPQPIKGLRDIWRRIVELDVE